MCGSGEQKRTDNLGASGQRCAVPARCLNGAPCGNDGEWKAKTAFHSPWKSLCDSHIPTGPMMTAHIEKRTNRLTNFQRLQGMQ